MKKFSRIIAFMLAITMILSGCASMQIKVSIKDANNAMYSMRLEVDKQLYDEDTIKNNPNISTPDEVEKEMRKEYAKRGDDIKVVVVTKKDGKQYYVISQEQPRLIDYKYRYASQESLGLKDLYLTEDTFYFTFDSATFKEILEIVSQQDPKASSYYNQIRFSYAVEFPRDIVSSQGGTINASNPKMITFDMPLNGKKTGFATANKAITIKTIKADIKKITSVKKPKIKSLEVKSVKKKKAVVKLKCTKVKGATYQIKYSTTKKFKKAKTKKSETNTVLIKKLKPGKKYYFKVRAVKQDSLGEDKFYSKYSKVKKIKIPKKK